MADWDELARAAEQRHRDGEARLPEDADARQRQLTRMGNAAYAAGLCHLMAGRGGEARAWLVRAADAYRRSWADAPPGSWGRPIGATKALLLAGDDEGAAEAARWALDEGAAASESPIGRYAAALAALTVGDEDAAREHADAIRTRDDFPRPVGDALAAIAAEDPLGYVEAVEAVLGSFEERDEYLEGVPVADTVLVLQALAHRRGMSATLASPLLPG